MANFTISHYDPHSLNMDVDFRGGERRRYFGVPAIVHDELIRTPYPDQSFYYNVVRCQYPNRRVA